MAWHECKQCHKKIFHIEGRPLPHDGYCGDCFELITGQCAECEGTGTLQRAHLGTMECPKCEGTGQAGRSQ